MIDTLLVPPNTVIASKGDGVSVALEGASNRVFLITLNITKIVEQEALELSIFGSADGEAWPAKPLLTFPQQFYPGESPMLLDLCDQPDAKYLRAHWEVNRWGRGPEEPMFEIGVCLKEVPQEMLAAAR
jgi:hypothetical protein